MKAQLFLHLLTGTLLCGILCACNTAPVGVTRYDFGAAVAAHPAAACKLPPLYIADIISSAALDNDFIQYRLLYTNDQQARMYASHRWSMPPAQLLGQRLKSQLADQHVLLLDAGMSNPDGVQLHLDLDDFGHYFSDPQHSYFQVKLRASLLRSHKLIAQTTFSEQASATGADAPAGVQAMRTASDTLIAAMTAWLCQQQ